MVVDGTSNVEGKFIRGLDVDKIAKGFATRTYTFKGECTVADLQGDSIRWYQKTAGTLTATTPSNIEISPLSSPDTIEQQWTRNTSFPKKYMIEGFISEEDIDSADLQVLTVSITDLTQAVVAKVDKAIYNIMTEDSSGTPTPDLTPTAASVAAWDADSGQDPISDILNAVRLIEVQDYDAASAVLYLNPFDYQSLLTWLISTKGSSIPGFSSEKVRTGVVLELVGVRIKKSNNVTIDWGLMILPQKACTWRSSKALRATTIVEEMIGTKIRVSESGIAYLTDPKTIVQISNLTDTV